MALQDLPSGGLGRDPIPGPDPAGENVRYEEEFTRLEDEIGKMQSAGPAAVDWPSVVSMASAILAGRSKDLLVASWLTVALNREEGMRGLAAGIDVIQGIVETYWEDCFPPIKRMRARVGAIEWIAERAGTSLADVTATSENAELIVQLFDAVDGLDRTFSEKADGVQANLGDLLRPLRNLKRDADFMMAEVAKKAAAAAEAEAAAQAAASAEPAPSAEAAAPADGGPPAASDEPAASPPAAPTPVAPATPAAPPAPAPVAAAAPPPVAAVAVPAASGPEMDRAINTLRSNVVAMAKAIRSASPGDPRSYQLLRSVLWLPVQAAPPDQDGRTMLPDPTRELGPVLATLADAGDPLKLLEFCEGNAVDRLFWLDLHRHSASALGALGHTAARDALQGQTAAFLKRFPKVVGLAFDGGTAFADAATRMWITDELMSSGSAGGAGAGDGLGADFAEIRSNARALAAKGNLGDAAVVFENARNQAVGERSRFLWDLEKARLCMDAGRPDLAMSLLMHLDKLSCKFSLDVWDPSVCVDLTTMLLRGSSLDVGGEVDPDWATLRREWTTRLSRLDMRAAVELGEFSAQAGAE
ncbi:type VI secretion system protein TssA [Thalassobaculum sp.]|uniref:type VI secretion system protein TssA n=1 Tax=Thalassobaculum sp. TaxID=2022740 RepID=UPI0032EF0A45